MKRFVMSLVATLALAGAMAAQGPAESITVGPNAVEVTARHPDGTVFFHHVGHNLKTYAGGDFLASVMSNTSAQPAAANYMAVSTDATSPSPSDLTMAGEVTTSGLARTQGVYAHSTCVSFPCTYTLAHTWTATGAVTALQKAAVFNASSAGTMLFENVFGAVSLASGDTLQLTWTVSLQ